MEVENGLLGVKRDTSTRLIELMTFKNDLLIRNLIGISGESVCWINHFHFTAARTFVERHIIPSKKERGKEITIKFRSIIFSLAHYVKRSILINILIKNTILEWTFKINKDDEFFYVGICTPKQINNVMVGCLGWKDCGGCFYFDCNGSNIICFGKYSLRFKEGGIKKEEEITAVVNNKNENNKEKGGKMNIIRNQKRVPHTIVNIPKDGVHFGFTCYNGSCYNGLVTLSVISFLRVSVLPPPFNDGMKCIAYDFEGGFQNWSYDHKDEEGEEVPNIRREYCK